ncbi:MAG: glycosyltransferase family 2 protein [Betaproteobacteria bacterium]|nr:glycosyltransferase family 2 protein [Betaproteobacteria bacterium]
MMPDTAPPPVFLSIVIPTHDYGHLLGRALDSVLTQLSADCELVVIDDGSTDGTSQLLEERQAVNPERFRWVRQANAGAAAARNAGIRLSRGAYLLFLDADDELLPGALDAVRDAVRTHPQASVIVGGRITRRDDGREKYHPPPFMLPSDPYTRLGDYLLRKNVGMSHGSTVARRDLILQHPYPERLRGREDIPVFAHLFVNGEFVFTDHPMVRIHKHQDSLRHVTHVSDAQTVALVDEIFSGMPASCQSLRNAYAARRYLSLVRIALRAGDAAAAWQYWCRAATLDVKQVLRPAQIRKTLKAGFAALSARKQT